MNRSELVELRRSVIAGAIEAVRESLLPSVPNAVPDIWYDADSGKEWNGPEVVETCKDVFGYVENWLMTLEESSYTADAS